MLSASVAGYTPAQIRHAYGFDQIALPNGGAADGSGQTIAIVDAFHDPNLMSDLNVFDTQFGLPAAAVQEVSQEGKSTLPVTDAGWAGEISLDVEWAHAIAPGATILVVEATSDSISDLMSAVDYARHAAGVSSVSMSWGGSEFFSWNGGESSSQTNYDPVFTTPAGHQGVSFVASAGDSGAQVGVQWPSISPNVISVGGTSLYISDASGTYATETGWSGSNGGFSQVESEPDYQQGAQSTGVRTAPDVSYNADPNTGFAVYDSLAYQGSAGWQEVGGTSAGAPQWAALLAIANQARIQAGLGSLDGATQTLPALYGTYGSPTTTLTDAYLNNFQDVTTGGTVQYRWRWGGTTTAGYSAQVGYDLVTGLGSPKAAAVVSTLVSAGGATVSSGTPGAGAAGSNSPAPAVQAASPIAISIRNNPSASLVEGKTDTLRVRLQNLQASAFTGPVSVKLFLSTDESVSGNDELLKTVTLANLKLKPGHAHTLKIKFAYPTDAAGGAYDVLAQFQATDTDTAPATAVAGSPVTLSPQSIDIAITFTGARPATSLVGGQSKTVRIKVQDTGNVSFVTDVTVSLFGSVDGEVDGSDTLLGSVVVKDAKLKPGKAITVKIRFTAPLDPAPGSYNLIATATAPTQPADANPANNQATIPTTA